MVNMSAPSGASEALRHAVDLTNRNLDGLLEKLSTGEQHAFWTDLRHYALAEMRHEGRNARLIASEHLNEPVREALEMIDAKIAQHLENASPADTAQFWELLHSAADIQEGATRQPKARHGG
jgi:hypothetical protein